MLSKVINSLIIKQIFVRRLHFRPLLIQTQRYSRTITIVVKSVCTRVTYLILQKKKKFFHLTDEWKRE